MNVALAPLTVGRPAPALLVAAAAAAGFRQVGLTLWPPDGPPSPLCADARGRRDLLSRLTGSAVSVLDVGVVVLGPALDLAAVATLVHAAGALGGDRLIVMNTDDDRRRAAQRFAAVCDIALSAGMSAAVEFMPYTTTRTLHEACDLVDASGAPNAGVVLDVLHLFRSGGSTADLATIDAQLLHLVQLCDARAAAPPADRLRAEALGDRRYPGDGELSLLELLAALPPGVPLTVEAPVASDAGTPPAGRARAAAAALRRLGERVSLGR